MSEQSLIVFVCEHGAAKSVVAAAYFNKLAAEGNFNVRAIARGTTPDAALSPAALAGLKSDGLTPSESIPQKLSLADIDSAQRIISFCDLPDEAQGKAALERWDNVPPVSEDYDKARDVIVEKIQRLANSL